MKTPAKYTWIIVVVIALAINWLSSIYHYRIDLTNENRFTLTQPTKKLLQELPGNVKIDVFLKGNYPSGFRQLASSTADMLQEMQEAAGASLRYDFYSPEDIYPGSGTSYGDSLYNLGVTPINLTAQLKEGQTQQLVFPVAIVHYKDMRIPVMLYQGKTPLINFGELNSAEAMLEYNLANAIAKVTDTARPTIGYATGHGEPTGLNTYDLVNNILAPNYQLYTFDLRNQAAIPPQFNALMIVKPTIQFTEAEKLKIDQYVMQGGNLLLFIDKLNAELDTLQGGDITAFDRDLQLDDLIFRYGARINPDLVMDLQCDYLPFDVSGDGQFELLPWNYFPVFESGENHPINKNLGFISGNFVNSIDTIEVPGVTKTILLASSANSRTIGTPAIISGRENVIAPESEKFRQQAIPVAVLLEGRFRSLFTNRLSRALSDSLSLSGGQFIPQGIKGAKIVVVADGDMVLNNTVKGEAIPMGMNSYTYNTQREFPFANRDFLLNSIDYLVNNNGLMQAKGKEYTLRLLNTTKVEENKLFWQLINILLPVLIIIISGIIYFLIRKKIYT